MGRVTGLGIYKPMTHYPPFYSMVLALFERCGMPALDAGRWISISAFGLSIILAGLIVYQVTRSKVFSLLTALLVICSNVVLRTFSWALSEPLYIVLLLLSFFLLGVYLQALNRRWLVLAAVSASLALLTRYVGFAPAAALSLALLSNRRFSWARRLTDAVIFLSIAGAPTMLDRIGERLQAILASHCPTALAPATLARIDEVLAAAEAREGSANGQRVA